MGVTFNLLFVPNKYRIIGKILEYMTYGVAAIIGMALAYFYFVLKFDFHQIWEMFRISLYIFIGLISVRGLILAAKRDEQFFMELNESFIFIKDQRYAIEDTKDIRFQYGGACGQNIRRENEIETASGTQNTIYFIYNGKLIVQDFFIQTRLQWSETQEIIELWKQQGIGVEIKKMITEA
jgi:hypothetical protein